MALITCGECNGKVSDQAEACPHCGCPVEASITTASPGSLQLASRPWSPYLLMVIAIGSAILGSPLAMLWGGIVTTWNWRRFGYTSRIYRPIIVAAIGAMSIWLPLAGFVESTTGWCIAYGLGVFSAFVIVWFDLRLQDEAMKQHQAAGGRSGSFLLPCGITLAILIVNLLWWRVVGSDVMDSDPGNKGMNSVQQR
jgi:hypothetical protein